MYYNEYEHKDKIRNNSGFEDLHMPYWGHLLLFIALYFGASLIVIVASLVLKLFLTEEFLNDPIAVENLSNVLSNVVYIVLLVAFCLIFRKSLKEIISRFKLKSTWTWFGIGLAIIYGGAMIYSQILEMLGVVSTSANQDSINTMISNTPFWGFLYVCVLAPIMEELMFRLGLYRAIKNKTLAFIVTVVTFAGMHLLSSITAGTLAEDLTSLPSYLIGAVGLTLVYHESKSIVSSIITHMTYNTIGFLAIIAVANLPETTESMRNFISFFANIF